MNRPNLEQRHVRTLLLVLAVLLVLGTAFGCHSGTPAAPAGTDILLSFEYIEQDLPTGDFTAIVHARVFDDVSNAPHTGVGVFFEASGRGQFREREAVKTNGSGKAQKARLMRASTIHSRDVAPGSSSRGREKSRRKPSSAVPTEIPTERFHSGPSSTPNARSWKPS